MNVLKQVYVYFYQRIYIKFIFKIWKWIIHLLTGNSELERICLEHNHSIENIQRLEISLLNSTKLKNICKYSQGYYYLDYTQGLKNIYDIICKIKKIHKYQAKKELFQYLSELNQVKIAIDLFTKLKNEKYDQENVNHEKYLEELWDNLKPNQKRSGRKTKEWQEIGFQGDNPSTDFRGMGILGLMCLNSFSKSQASKNVLLDSNHKKYWYPFAIVGILVSNEIYQEIKSMKWNQYFYNCNDQYLDVFYKLFHDRFIQFNDYLMKNQVDITKFEEYKKNFFNK